MIPPASQTDQKTVGHVVRLTIYPVKSFDGIDLSEVEVLANGAFANDRRWAFREIGGQLVTAKRFPMLHRIRAKFSEDLCTITLTCGDNAPEQFAFPNPDPLKERVGRFLGTDVELMEESAGGFPDDTDRPGPTIIGRETLEAISEWFGEFDLIESHRRFRANMECEFGSPFAEDGLLSPPEGPLQPFWIGSVGFTAGHPCQRCAVPARNSDTGEAIARFQKLFAERRGAAWRTRFDPSVFGHDYRVAINCRRSAEVETEPNRPVIRIGDGVEVVGTG